MSNAARCPRCNGSLYYEVEPDGTPVAACLLCPWRQEGTSNRQRLYAAELAALKAGPAEPYRGRGRPAKDVMPRLPRPDSHARRRREAAERCQARRVETARRHAHLAELVALGWTDARIAAELGIGRATANQRRRRLGLPGAARKRVVSASPPRAAAG